MTISNTEYWAQVREIAGSVIEAAKDALVIDSTSLDVYQVYEKIEEFIGEKLNKVCLYKP